MCKDCVDVKFPDRGSSCLEKGAYLVNYKGCANCKMLGFMEEVDRQEEQDEDEETVTFTHVCKKCGHEIAKHSYTFSHDGEFQEYSMECLLCGQGGSTHSILPHDPREKMLY
jgi:RecJ-like exonuclease